MLPRPALLAGAAPVLTGYIHASGVPNTFAYAAADRDFTVVLIGNPFAEPRETVTGP